MTKPITDLSAAIELNITNPAPAVSIKCDPTSESGVGRVKSGNIWQFIWEQGPGQPVAFYTHNKALAAWMDNVAIRFRRLPSNIMCVDVLARPIGLDHGARPAFVIEAFTVVVDRAAKAALEA